MGDYFGCAIICAVALVMVIIGIVQFTSKEPVAFYSGEKRYKPEELTDVKKWNKLHGLMWIGFGVAMALGSILSIVIKNSFWGAAVLYAGMLVPLPLMIKGHQLMIRKYKKDVPKKKRKKIEVNND